uniref:Uncharacterized protein n=1 Tax=Myotis myotis TaxID=51298 RepID=A0A7J8AM23_MYOMY|nr:hypothetical protein mMyoMyo1_007804 [Myotis myotis]
MCGVTSSLFLLHSPGIALNSLPSPLRPWHRPGRQFQRLRSLPARVPVTGGGGLGWGGVATCPPALHCQPPVQGGGGRDPGRWPIGCGQWSDPGRDPCSTSCVVLPSLLPRDLAELPAERAPGLQRPCGHRVPGLGWLITAQPSLVLRPGGPDTCSQRLS